MNFKLGLVMALLSAVTFSAYGQQKKAAPAAAGEKKQHNKSLHDQFTGQGYGLAGCGLGSVVFGQKPGMIQVFAATTNGIGYNQSFGLSSGTSNCGESSQARAAAEYIEINKVTLENDMARGQGETMATLSKVLGCKNENFGQELRSQYQVSFPKGGANSEQIQAVAYKACQI